MEYKLLFRSEFQETMAHTQQIDKHNMWKVANYEQLLTTISLAGSIHQYKVLAKIAIIIPIVLVITSKKWYWAYAFTMSLVKLWQYITRINFTKVTETIIPTTQCHFSPSNGKPSCCENLEIELTKVNSFYCKLEK